MSTAHKIAITVVVLFVGISTAPATVAAVDFPSDGDWENEFNDNDDVSDSSYTPLEAVYVDNTRENQVLFRAVLDEGDLSNAGLGEGSQNDALQIYIDAGEGGIDSDTGSGGGWGTFFDGLDGMNADYRITAEADSAVVEEHQSDVFFNTVSSSDESTDGVYELESINSGTNNEIKFALDRDTIENPETLDVKFAYIEDSLGAATIETSKFGWAPESSVRLGSTGDGGGATQTATLTTEVKFGSEPVDDDATVDITLTDGNGNVAGSAEGIDYDGSGTLSREFTINPADFNGEGEFSAEVVGGDSYTFERDVDNTKSIGGISGDATKTLGISTLTADVDLSDVNPANDASVEVTLTDKDGTETPRVIEEIPANALTETFTVNPANFDSDAELTVEVVGDESVPYTKTETASVTSGDSNTVSFAATGVGHEFTLDPPSSTVINGDSDTFVVDVSLKSESSGGSNIYTVDHRINFDDAELVDEEDGLGDITVTPASGLPSDAFVKDVSIEGDGVVRVIVASTDDSVLVENTGSQTKLYDISFEYEDGLKAELPKTTDAAEFSPSTSDATEIMDGGDDQLDFISSSGTVTVENTEERITSAEVTHLSEYANMDGFESFEYEVTVETNDAAVDRIGLSSDAITGPNSGKTKQCGNSDNDDDASTCTVTFELTPEDDTAGTGTTYSTDQLDIDAEMKSGDSLDITAQNTGVTSDELNVRVYQTGDFPGTGAEDSITVDDIERGVDSYLDEEAAGETWGTDQLGGAATYDVNGDREVGITDITAIIDEYNN